MLWRLEASAFELGNIMAERGATRRTLAMIDERLRILDRADDLEALESEEGGDGGDDDADEENRGSGPKVAEEGELENTLE
jgi:hypothetical protein